jgi:hypothetical protein
MGKYINIFINPKAGIAREDIEKKMNLAIDWYRYNDNAYIVYTTSDANKWQDRLLEFVKDEGGLFICELNTSNRSGFMTSSFWDWLEKKRNRLKPK